MGESEGRALPSISVFGLGKLGSVVAGCHANKGFRVVGYDVVAASVAACRRGAAPVRETGIDELFEASAANLTATPDPEEAVRTTDVTMVVVPTPSEPGGGFSLAAVLEACESIGKAIGRKSSYHLVALKSTVMPGAAAAEIVPALERASGKKVGKDFGYCYNPEFIALGSIIRNIYEPDLVLIGESDERAGALLEGIYDRTLERRDAPIARMSFVNAELAKLSVNSYVTLKITFANLLAALCERLPGGDADEVTAAIGLDTRIGAKYLKPGLGFGGPCFPRDNRALLALARELDVSFPLARATDEANATVVERVSALVQERLPAGARVAVLGMSYKPDTPVIDESQGVMLAEELASRGCRVSVYDPQALEPARARLGARVTYAASARECTDGADAVVLATAWPEFRDAVAALAARTTESALPLLLDCWGMIPRDLLPPGRVLRVGVNPGRGVNPG